MTYFNRNMYDACASDKALEQSIGPLSYVINPLKYENCDKCFITLGTVGGASSSTIRGNQIDLENDLRNQNRPNTHCVAYKYKPTKCNYVQGKEYIKPVTHPRVNTTPVHLPSCHIVTYGSVSAEPVFNIQTCDNN